MIITPSEDVAIRILYTVLHKRVKTIQRFPTGLANFVYDVETDDSEKLVVRLARPDLKYFFEGALKWYDILKGQNVPLPTLYYSTLDEAKFGFPVMIMERLLGTDLDQVYSSLSAEQKHRIAEKIIAIQQSVADLPIGRGYGYARSPDDPFLYSHWINVLEANLERSSQRFKKSGFLNGDILIERVRQAIFAHQEHFSTIQPICFLDDITTKNVLIDYDGTLSGIVDVDAVAFGDPLLTLSLTRMALLGRGYDTHYTDYWASQLNLTSSQWRAVDLYTAIFCLDFMSEMGHSFNKDTPVPIDQVRVKNYVAILDTLLG